MTRIFGTGGASALVAALLLLVGGSSEALAAPADIGVTRAPLIEMSADSSGLAEPLVLVSGQAAGTAQQVAVLPANLDGLALSALVDANSAGLPLDEEENCLATAVYFEAKGESLEGQLAVANVVRNRAASGRYPTNLCAVVRQKAQFSFVVGGQFPSIDPACESWRKAQAIARIAARMKLAALPSDVLWYHADYVAPSWRRGLRRAEKIGAHIFYRV